MSGTKGRSARGETVDFDVMKIKQQLSDAPKAVEVKKREEMITAKRRRRKVAEPVDEPVDESTDDVKDSK